MSEKNIYAPPKLADKPSGFESIDRDSLGEEDKKTYDGLNKSNMILISTLLYISSAIIFMIIHITGSVFGVTSDYDVNIWMGVIKYGVYIALAYYGDKWSRCAMIALLIWHALWNYQVLNNPLFSGSIIKIIFFYLYTFFILGGAIGTFIRVKFIKEHATT